jgi:hypothetical protein
MDWNCISLLLLPLSFNTYCYYHYTHHNVIKFSVLQERAAAESSAGPVEGFSYGSIVLEGPLDVGSEFERRLAIGAGIACRLRGAVREHIGE